MCNENVLYICIECGWQRGCSTPAQDKPSSHRLCSWCVNTPLIDLNEAAAGFLVGWEPLCQYGTVNGSENVANLPSSLLFLFPTTQCRCVLALGCWSATVAHTNTLQKTPLLWVEAYQAQWCHSQWVPGPRKGWEVAGEAGTAMGSKTSACSSGSTKGIHILMWSWVNRWVLLCQAPQVWIADGSMLWKNPWAGGNHPRCPFRLSPPSSWRAEQVRPTDWSQLSDWNFDVL